MMSDSVLLLLLIDIVKSRHLNNCTCTQKENVLLYKMKFNLTSGNYEKTSEFSHNSLDNILDKLKKFLRR